MEDAIAYVGSSGDLLCKSCLVWMCAAGWILSSSPTWGGVLCSDLGGRLGNEEKKKKKNVVLFTISINVGWAYAHP